MHTSELKMTVNDFLLQLLP